MVLLAVSHLLLEFSVAFLLFLTCGAAFALELSPAIDLRADNLASPSLGVSGQPILRFSFPSGVATRGMNVSLVSFRMVVTPDGANKAVWDSGDIAVGQATDPANGFQVGVPLRACTAYRWVAQYTCNGSTGTSTSPPAMGQFNTGVGQESDWRGAAWLGNGHGEFKVTLPSLGGATVSPNLSL